MCSSDLHCLDETESIYLDKCRKNVYPYNRHFLPPRHHLRKKGKHFNGNAETRTNPIPRSGANVFGMVKDLNVIFGKGPGREPVPNDADGHAPMWKKKSIFWELEYWECQQSTSQKTTSQQSTSQQSTSRKNTSQILQVSFTAHELQVVTS